ncbi:hypothetical protein GP486_006949, partial [Trichoglossum hirsutum]
MDVRSYSSVPPPIEILVHTSAPCGARDDERYRAQAVAYLDFEPCRSHALLPTRGPPATDTTLVDPLGAEGIDKRKAAEGTSSATVGSGNGEKKDAPFRKILQTGTIGSGNGEKKDALSREILPPDTIGLGDEEKEDAPFRKVLPKPRARNPDADPPYVPGSTVGGAATKCDALGRDSNSSATLQSTARIPSGTRAPLNNQNDASRRGKPMGMPSSITRDIQSPVHAQMDPSPAEHTSASRLPPLAKHQRIPPPDRLLQDGNVKTNEPGAEHPCNHSFNITRNEAEQ